MLCVKCGKELPEGSTICTACGARQDKPEVCPRCGCPVGKDAQFCSRCGTHIDRKSENEFSIPSSSRTGEPFYRRWIAAHRQLAEAKHITWISEFRGNYAVAADDSAPGREIRPFLVRGENTAEVICYMSWTGVNLSNGVIEREGDCFRNGAGYLGFILFRSSGMISPDVYRTVLREFTGLTMPLSTSGIVMLISRDSTILFAQQYQENATGITDIFPLRVIGRKYCLYTSARDYNIMTNKERYNAASELVKTAPQKIIDCESGQCIMDNILMPRYDGDPSGNFVEYFGYIDNITEKVLRVPSEKDRKRCIFNRITGKNYVSSDTVGYKPLEITDRQGSASYLLLKLSDIKPVKGRSGMTMSAGMEFIDGNDETVITLGRHDISYLPELIRAGGRLYISTHSPETVSPDGSADCINSFTDIYCFEITGEGKYRKAASGRLKTGGGFSDGIVKEHTLSGKTETLSGVFMLGGKTYISLIKERSDPSEEYDKCLLLDENFRMISWFNYRVHYGDQAPYGIHIFGDAIYSLSSEEGSTGRRAVLKNVFTGETVFSVPASGLISRAGTQFGKANISPSYDFGSYRICGKPYFLTGKQNRQLGIMDFRGNTVIPEDSANYFIASSGAVGMVSDGKNYARLPADMFLIVLDSFDSDSYRLCGADGKTVFEGSMKELIEKYA